jgi:hypothetical protein
METRARYAEHRPYVVADSLEQLMGPTHGLVKLPVHLDWSGGRRAYDLGRDRERNVLYERVLREALTVDDLARYVNDEMLRQAWPELFLPARVREAWERRFPQLAKAA